MKILAVSDEECPALWDYYVPGRLDGYDLILSCGDLKAAYLTFLVTMGRARLLYVHGNHDASYLASPPEGCEDIDGHLIEYRGVKILGLGGCMWYHPGEFQYTEHQMERRVSSLRRALKKYGVDIVIAHAPPRGYGDLEDHAHRGFESFTKLIEEFHPKYFLHGHTHLRYNPSIRREMTLGGTKIVNVSERYSFEIASERGEPEDDVVWLSRRRREKESWDTNAVK